jgi:outer membrane protein assembly factor BamB
MSIQIVNAKQSPQRKQTLTAIALTLILATSIFIVSIPFSRAENIDTYAFISVAPNPVGVNQQVNVLMWLSNVPPTASGAQGDRWENFTVTVTKPDGTTQILGPYRSDSVGSCYTTYTPDALGTYTFQMHFPGQSIAGIAPFVGPINNTYSSSESNIITLNVIQQQIQPLPETELPTNYWKRPIYGENRDWYQISGNWLMSGYNAISRFNPYTTAPSTAHIVWTKDIAFGGLIGGSYGSVSYYTGMSYERKIQPPVIMNGRLYYNTPDPPRCGYYCIDLRTGEQLWYANATGLSIVNIALDTPRTGGITLGQIYNYESPNQHGGIPYLWNLGSNYEMYDAYTGQLILIIKNASTGTTTYAPDGSLLVYLIGGTPQNYWLAMWNSSKAIPPSGPASQQAWQWRPDFVVNMRNKTLNWNDGIQWNITLPSTNARPSILKIGPDMIYTRVTIQTQPTNIVADTAYSIKPGEEGKQLWGPIQRDPQPSRDAGPMDEGVYVEFVKETLTCYGYDTNTGNLLWTTSPRENAWAMYGSSGIIAYGKLYITSYDGRIYCYDIKNGQKLWTYYTGSSGLETVYGHWPFYGAGSLTVADNILFATNDEHSPNSPLYKGATLTAIDVNTGERIWNISGWMQSTAIADGYLISLNGYDNQLYCFGKGQTATTITASPKVVAKGTSILIEGTITDQSPGQTCLGIPAAGTPAISDQDQTAWMRYLYQQQSKPENAQGVQIHLKAIDQDNNTEYLGYVTSDANGLYKLLWIPQKGGTYTIIATFEGSNAYYPSQAQTAIGVSSTAQDQPISGTTPTAAIQPQLDKPTETLLIATAAIIITLIIIVLAIVLNKRSKRNSPSKNTNRNNQSPAAIKPYVPFHFPFFSTYT